MAHLDRLSIRAVAVAVAVAAVLGLPRADRDATALGADDPDRGWVTTPDGTPLFDLAGIAPGDSGSATLAVTNPGDGAVTVSVGITSLRTDDNGCVEPERAAGDVTCAGGGGELQDELWLTLAADDGERQLTRGTLATWTERPAADPTALAPHATRAYEVSYHLPLESSNVTQSDLVEFQLEVRLEDVSDVDSEGPTVVVPATPSLPTTGAATGWRLLGGLVLVVVGVAALRSARRGRAG